MGINDYENNKEEIKEKGTEIINNIKLEDYIKKLIYINYQVNKVNITDNEVKGIANELFEAILNEFDIKSEKIKNKGLELANDFLEGLLEDIYPINSIEITISEIKTILENIMNKLLDIFDINTETLQIEKIINNGKKSDNSEKIDLLTKEIKG